MTIASEITRLQGAKADIKTAIENKGVTVGSSDTIDCYSACIDAIQSGSSIGFVDILVVGGGGNGGCGCPSAYYAGGGGGGGGVIYRKGLVINGDVLVEVGAATCNSKFGEYIAYGGGNGGNGSICGTKGCPGGSGGGNGGSRRGYEFCIGEYCRVGGLGCSGQGAVGKTSFCYMHGGGGGGYGEDCNVGCVGGNGFTTDFSGTNKTYAGGGGGGKVSSGTGNSGGTGGGGTGGTDGCWAFNATYYGGGGGGGGVYSGYCAGGKGYGGIVKVRYKTDGSYGIDPELTTGGCKTTCGDYTFHSYYCTGCYCFCPVFK